jgi:hypothetical protein
LSLKDSVELRGCGQLVLRIVNSLQILLFPLTLVHVHHELAHAKVIIAVIIKIIYVFETMIQASREKKTSLVKSSLVIRVVDVRIAKCVLIYFHSWLVFICAEAWRDSSLIRTHFLNLDLVG